jgi:hypothetical protein
MRRKADVKQQRLLDIGTARVALTMLWHYTPMRSAKAILRGGFIEPRTQCKDFPPSVWFSANQFIERTAVGMPDGSQRAGTYTRFGVDKRMTSALDLRRFNERASIEHLALWFTGRSIGADPAQWWLTNRHVDVSMCTVETWTGTLWMPLTAEQRGRMVDGRKSPNRRRQL